VNFIKNVILMINYNFIISSLQQFNSIAVTTLLILFVTFSYLQFAVTYINLYNNNNNYYYYYYYYYYCCCHHHHHH